MNRCLELAQLGAGYVSSNPMVGAVLVFENRIIGEGYHQRYGEAHAEVNCIDSVTEENEMLIEKSTLYVSLEPCSHTGKTPPCVDKILSCRIPKVVIGCQDISAKVNGKGIQKLRDAGVEVIVGVMEDESIELNKRFFTFHQRNRPYIILKWAESIEGFIGNGEAPIKLSNKETDKLVHQWRAEEDAIWVGYRTAKIDNPRLNVRLVEGRNPIRIVYDRDLSLGDSLHLFDQTQSTFVFNTQQSSMNGKVEYIQISGKNPIQEILKELYKRSVLSVLIEGGTQLLQQCIDQNMYDEIRCIKTSTSLPIGVKAPEISTLKSNESIVSEEDTILIYRNEKSRSL